MRVRRQWLDGFLDSEACCFQMASNLGLSKSFIEEMAGSKGPIYPYLSHYAHQILKFLWAQRTSSPASLELLRDRSL